MTTRRRLLALALGSGLSAPLGARAQGRMLRVGWMPLERGATGAESLGWLRAGLRDLGYFEGLNLTLFDAYAGADAGEGADKIAQDLIRSGPDIIVTTSANAIRKSGTTLPVVFAFSGDPVEAGLIDTLARPGRNFTGVSFLSLDLAGKRIEMLKELMPGLRHVGIIARPEHAGERSEFRVSEAAAQQLGLSIAYFPVHNAQDMERALTGARQARCGAMVVFPDGAMMRYSEQIAAFAAAHRIPAISGWSTFAERGNVMSYGPLMEASFRHLATFVDKIWKGRKPADLPVELPLRFELLLNLKVARQLGLRVPLSLLVRADRVIE